MRPQIRPSVIFRELLVVLGVALAYFAAAKLGLSLSSATKQVTAVWPASGIALAALLIGGYRCWPGIWLGAFAINAISAEPLSVAAAIAAGDTLAPLAGTWLLRCFDFHNRLERVRDVVIFALFGVAIAMTVSATVGVASLSFAHIVTRDAMASVWWTWWAGDATGALFAASLLVVWLPFPAQRIGSDRRLELALLGVCLITVSWLSFASAFPIRLSVYPLVIWVALRFKQRETTLALAVTFAIAMWATAHGLGPWGSGRLDVRLIQLDSWMASLALTALVLSAVTAERYLAREALQALLVQSRHSVERLQTALLPDRLPQRAGLRCDAVYIAAQREGLIGGDWYDGYELPDGRVFFSIGDIAGHGLDAAAAAVRLRREIFAAAVDAEGPAEILERAARAWRTGENHMATAFVALLSPDLSSMRYASAGHPPPYLAAPHAAARELPFGGVPFGVGVPIAAQTYEAALEPGSVLLLYTDGLTEFDRDITRAERAVADAVTALAAGIGLDAPANYVQRAVMGAHPPPDDTVLLVVRLESALQQSWTYDSRDAGDAHVLRRQIARLIRQDAAPGQDLYSAELVIGEIFANTVEHAPGLVRVELDWTHDHPVVTVRDDGPGLPDGDGALPRDPLSEDGRGLYLIRMFAQTVEVVSAPGAGTRIRVELPLVRANLSP